MAEITKEMIYCELLVLEAKMVEFEKLALATLEIVKGTNQDLAKGRAELDALKLRYGFTN